MFQIFFYRINQIFVDIFAKNTKGWSGKSKILCIEQSGRAEKNTRKQKFSLSSPSLCKYFPNIFLSASIRKYLLLFFPRVCSTGPLSLSHPSARLSEGGFNQGWTPCPAGKTGCPALDHRIIFWNRKILYHRLQNRPIWTNNSMVKFETKSTDSTWA